MVIDIVKRGLFSVRERDSKNKPISFALSAPGEIEYLLDINGSGICAENLVGKFVEIRGALHTDSIPPSFRVAQCSVVPSLVDWEPES